MLPRLALSSSQPSTWSSCLRLHQYPGMQAYATYHSTPRQLKKNCLFIHPLLRFKFVQILIRIALNLLDQTRKSILVWWLMPVIPAPGMLRQEDCNKFNVSRATWWAPHQAGPQFYRARVCLKQNRKLGRTILTLQIHEHGSLCTCLLMPSSNLLLILIINRKWKLAQLSWCLSFISFLISSSLVFAFSVSAFSNCNQASHDSIFFPSGHIN